MWFVYALYNKENDRIYIGETSDIGKRINEHNSKRGNHYTAKFTGNWILIYKEELTDRTDAKLRERQLKSYRGRQFLKNLKSIKS